jgi:hypothetical protein
MRRMVWFGIGLAVMSALGCARVEDTLIINPDGTGSLTRSIQVAPDQMIEAGQNLPLTEEAIKALAGPEGVTMQDVTVLPTNMGGMTVKFTVAFKDIQTFVRAPAGRLLPFTIRERGAGVAILEVDPVAGLLTRFSTLGREQWPVLLSKMAPSCKGSGYILHITLPDKPLAGKEASVNGNTATWAWDAAALTQESVMDAQGNPKYPAASFMARAITFSLPVDAAAPLKAPRFIKAGELAAAGFRFLVLGYQMIHNVEYDDEGRFKNASRTPTLRLRLKLPDGMRHTLADRVVLDAAVTDQGEDLAVTQGGAETFGIGLKEMRMYGRKLQSIRGGGQEPPSIIIPLNLKTPAKPFGSFSNVKGSVLLACHADTTLVKFGPAGPLVGKKLDIPGTVGITLTLQSIQPQVVIVASAQMEEWIESVSFTNAVGQPVSGYGSHQMASSGKVFTYTYYPALPEDGYIALGVLGEKEMIEVQFDLQDIRLEAGPAPVIPVPDRAPGGEIF